MTQLDLIPGAQRPWNVFWVEMKGRPARGGFGAVHSRLRKAQTLRSSGEPASWQEAAQSSRLLRWRGHRWSRAARFHPAGSLRRADFVERARWCYAQAALRQALEESA